MIDTNIEKLLNEQITKEFYSAYLYLSIEAYFQRKNWTGFANWFHVQAQEERDHAMLIFNFLNKVGGTVMLGTIDAPPADFNSPMEALILTYHHERLVTGSIYAIVDAAQKERDHKTTSFLQWFVNEQVEEETNADANVRKFELVQNDGNGILLLDKDMAARVYVPAVIGGV